MKKLIIVSALILSLLSFVSPAAALTCADISAIGAVLNLTPAQVQVFYTLVPGGCATGNLPVGCAGPGGFSPINGQPCVPIGTFLPGCLNSTGFSTTTGLPCSSTSSPVITLPTAAPTVSLTANGSTGPMVEVPYISPFTVSWTSQNAIGCQSSGTAGGWSSSNRETSGFLSILASVAGLPVEAPTTLTMTCRNGSGVTSSDSITVTPRFSTTPPPAQPSVSTFTANGASSATVSAGTPFTLAWTSNGCTYLHLQNNEGWTAWNGDFTGTGLNGSNPYTITTPGTYYPYLICQTAARHNLASRSVAVTVTSSSQTPPPSTYTGPYYLFTNPGNGGLITYSPTGAHQPGDRVTIMAQPNSGYTFTGWNGDASGVTNPLSLTFGAQNYTIGATFAAGAPPPPLPADFTITANQSSITSNGGWATNSIRLVSTVQGVPIPSPGVTLTASGLPAGASATFQPSPADVGSGTSDVSLSLTNLPGTGGPYTVTVTGTAGSVSHSTAFTLNTPNSSAGFGPMGLTGPATAQVGVPVTVTWSVANSNQCTGTAGIRALTVWGGSTGWNGDNKPPSGSAQVTFTYPTPAGVPNSKLWLNCMGPTGAESSGWLDVVVAPAAAASVSSTFQLANIYSAIRSLLQLLSR